MMIEYWYRYESRMINSLGLEGSGHVEMYCREHLVLRHTPCGVWLARTLNRPSTKPRWVSNTARKRYAYPTKELALTSFIRRKQRQVFLITCQLRHAEAAIKHALNYEHT